MQFQLIIDPTERLPVGAKATLTVGASRETVREQVRALAQRGDLTGSLRGIPMIKSLVVRGDLVSIAMQFKVAFFSVNFGCRGKAVRDGDTLHFQYLDGEPADTWLRFELRPAGDAQHSIVEVAVGFDLDSLGWVAKYFLKHHPEIRPGVFAGVAYAIADSIAQKFPG